VVAIDKHSTPPQVTRPAADLRQGYAWFRAAICTLGFSGLLKASHNFKYYSMQYGTKQKNLAALLLLLQVPAEDNNYHAELFPGPWRQDIKPLNVMQPEVRCAAAWQSNYVMRYTASRIPVPHLLIHRYMHLW
jgi:hypothetical protein